MGFVNGGICGPFLKYSFSNCFTFHGTRETTIYIRTKTLVTDETTQKNQLYSRWRCEKPNSRNSKSVSRV